MNISKALQDANKNSGYGCSEWTTGAMVNSSWHRQETLVSQDEMDTPEGFIEVGRRSGALPERIVRTQLASVEYEYVKDAVGNLIEQAKVLAVGPDQMQGITCYFGKDEHGQERPPKLVGAVGGRFRPLPVASFEQLIHAAFEAGCRGEAIFSLRNGARIVASFELPDQGDSRFKKYLTFIDSLDGSGTLQAIISIVRVVCANTVKSAQACCEDGNKIEIRHSGDIEAKAEALALAVKAAIREGTTVAQQYDQAAETSFTHEQWDRALDDYIPLTATVNGETVNLEDVDPRAYGKAVRKRQQVNQAAKLPVNVEGDGRNHATLYNALTWCVDRKFEANKRDGLLNVPVAKHTNAKLVTCPRTGVKTDGRSERQKSNERLDSMIDPAGKFSKGLSDINRIFERQIEEYKVLVQMADGSTVEMTAEQATDAGLPNDQIVGNLLDFV